MSTDRSKRARAGPQAVGNLPDRRTSFVGREQELEGLQGLLREARMITLTGAGGCGKTTLAIEAARSAAHFADGAWLAELAPVPEGHLVPGAVAGALGLTEEPGRSFVDVLTESLAPRQLLLVLDNCEHVLGGAAELCEEVLGRCPDLRILATSRQPLGVRGERRVPVAPLGVPEEEADAEAVASSEAGGLFLERARAVVPGMRIEETNAAAIGSICRRLDGIPLAIELAAARVGLLTAQEIDDRLGDRLRLLRNESRGAVPRHRTLRALIDWSNDLLDKHEAVLYARLGVFVGGFTLEAAEQVCAGEPLARDAVLPLLGQLVEKSLVGAEQHEGRTWYRMLETIREHASKRLHASGEEDELRCRHLAWYVAFLERSNADLAGPAQAEAARRVAREFDNVRAAFTWALASNDVPAALRLVTIRRFWQALQGHLGEAIAWFDAALERAEEAEPSLQAKALGQAGDLARVRGDPDGARSHLEQAAGIQRSLSDPKALGLTLLMLGRAEAAAGRTEHALEVTEESVAIARSVGDRQALGERLVQLAEITYERGAPEQARPLLMEGIKLARVAADTHAVADAQRVLGMLERDAGRFEEARSRLEQALALQREISDWTCASVSLSVLGDLALRAGEPVRAAALFRESLALQRKIGHWYRMVDCLWGLAAAASDQGLEERAAWLLGAEAMLREDTGATFRLASAERHVAVVQAVRQRMGDAAFANSYQEGQAMEREEALAYARADAEAETPATGAVSVPGPTEALAPSVFRLEGEYWAVVFGTDSFRLRDTKGLRYLARLLSEPGQEFHALDLVAIERGLVAGTTQASARDDRLAISGLGDSGKVLDQRAKAAYRARLADLEDDLAEAERFADGERAARAKREMDFLARELASAVGLGGRDRVAASASERARLNVTRAIKSAIGRLAENSPVLGRHLKVAIRTGTFCSYRPDPHSPVIWHL